MERKIKYGFNEREVDVLELCRGMSGWRDIITSLVDDLFGMGWDGCLLQIKEKFGGLRFYIGEGTDEMFDRISQAESQSLKTCMKCGKPGKPTDTGWILVLCEEHAGELLGTDTDTDSSAV
jgi:hypothetical protein